MITKDVGDGPTDDNLQGQGFAGHTRQLPWQLQAGMPTDQESTNKSYKSCWRVRGLATLHKSSQA